MSREDQIINERIRKINELNKLKIQPYAYRFDKEQSTKEILEKNEKLKPDERTKNIVKTAGRLLTIRDMGNLIFGHIQDQFGKIQIVLQKGETDEKKLDLFKKYIDAGDFVGVSGIVFKTKRGEVSILVKEVELLTKSILPLPEKWHGIQDEEERLRKRYLDMAMDSNVRKVFETRAKILEVMRDFMKKNKFIEVETPLLQAVYGGAAAKPFKTHCDAYNSDLYLSIAPELYLKKALVGGFDRVYEITKKFRNEGADRQHNPEHMTIEWYQGYADYNDGMEMFENLLKDIAKELFGKLEFEYQGNKINLAKWKKMPLLDAVKEYLNEDVSKVKTDSEAKKIAKKHNIDPNKVTKANLADELMKLFREKLIQPTFLTDYPIELAPLARPKRGDPTKAEIFQPFIGGMELARAYSELSEPLIQEANFKEQEEERKKGNDEAMPTDKDFIDALKHAMPPACGVGIGIERLTTLFTNQTTVREVIMFPFMKPEVVVKDKQDKENNKKGKKIDIKLPIDRKKAILLIQKYNKDEKDMIHFLESEAVMTGLAKKFGEDEKVWAMLGLLHDVDWGLTKENWEEHCIKAAEILKENGFSQEFIEIIQSHGYGMDEIPILKQKQRTQKIEYALAAGETLTGLIHAYALMRGGKISDMDASGLKKKFGDKKFAAAIDRNIIKECEKIGLKLEEFFELAINSIKDIAKEVGLK